MNSLKTTARKVGALYLVFALVAILNEFFISAGFIVPGDATATVHNIAAAELKYRIGILGSFINLILFVFLVVSLYNLFKDVDKKQGMLMVLFVLLGIGVSLVNLVIKTAPFILSGDSDYLSVFTKPQLDSLAMVFLNVRGTGANLANAFWGLWLFPFGILVIKSGFIPKLFGLLLMIAGFAYLTSGCMSIVLPAYRHAISPFLMPLYFGEVPIILWLLIKGAKVPQPQAMSSQLADEPLNNTA